MAAPEYVSARVRAKSLTFWSAPTRLLPPQVATAVENWKTAIREAQTFSRMHVLLGMLDASIKWDMSAENARCKVCRKKGKDSPGARKASSEGSASHIAVGLPPPSKREVVCF